MVELKETTPAEIASKPESFQYNEYCRLTGCWFIPLPCHFWQFKKGMEFEVAYDGELILLFFFDYLDKDIFSAFLNEYEWQHFCFSKIKRMRIKSFEVKDARIH